MEDNEKLIRLGVIMEDVVKKIDEMSKKLDDYNVLKSKVDRHERIIYGIGSVVGIALIGAIMALILR